MNILRKLFSRSNPATSARHTQHASAKPEALSSGDYIAIAKGERAAPKYTADLNDLEYGEALYALARSDNKLQTAARKRLAQLIDAQAVTKEQLDSDIGSAAQQIAIVQYCTNTSIFDALLTQHHSDTERAETCMTLNAPYARQKCVQSISDITVLKSLEKHFKSSDKTCYRLVKDKCEAFKKQELLREEQQNKLDKLLSELSHHSERNFNADYSFKLQSLERRRQTLAEGASDEWQSQTLKLIESCQTIIELSSESPVNEPPIVESPPISAVITADAEDIKAFTSLRDGIAKLFDKLFIIDALDADDRATLQAELDTFSAQKDTIDSSKIETTLVQDYIHLNEGLHRLLQAHAEDSRFHEALGILKAIQDTNDDSVSDLTSGALRSAQKSLRHVLAFCDKHAELNAQLKESVLGTTRSALIEKIKATEKAEKDENNHILGLIRKAQSAAQSGQLKRTQGLRFSIQEQLEKKKEIPSLIQRKWDDFLEQADKLNDWHTYAATPKLEQLVKEMQALAEAPLSAELQATKIKQLQDSWKSISKGSAGQYQELWDAFKAAADIAYEPCKEHYDKLDTHRAKNAELRLTLIQQLKNYLNEYDWDNANWSQVEQLLRSAKQEWQRYSPVARDQQKSLQNQFGKQIDAIQAKLDEEYQKNRQEKERLINGLEPLIKSEDLDQAIDRAIKFQQQWKTIGRCRRREDDALWNAFRGHCDAIFARRDAKRTEERGKIDEIVQAAEQALQKIIDISRIDDHNEFARAYRDIDTLREQFESIENLPPKKLSGMQSKLRKVLETLEQRHSTLAQTKTDEAWQQIFEIAQSIVALANSDEPDTQSILESIEQVQKYPGKTQKILRESAEKASQLNASTLTADTENQLRQLCIQAEIINGNDSPESDKTLRMQYQVEQLQSGLGQHRASKLELAELWLAIPSVKETQYGALYERFIKQWQAL